MKADYGIIALYFVLHCQAEPFLEEGRHPYGRFCEESETEELLSFVQEAMKEIERRNLHISADAILPDKVRITKALRIFIGNKELKIRPMAKTVLLLFLQHPEGIALKDIGNYQTELLSYYRRVMRNLDPTMAELRVQHILDIFNNDLNVNIARINAALSALVKDNARCLYRIQGEAGKPKSIPIIRSWVQWER